MRDIRSAQVALKVRGGFPVCVQVERCRGPGDEWEYEITYIRTPDGRPAEFILKRMSAKEQDAMLETAIDIGFH
jgi:hypothetical protein